jgi:hypothetical protein
MPRTFASREQWCDVSFTELQAFLRDYPRRLEARPPLTRKARYREWTDAALGRWPDNAVAKCWSRGKCLGFQVRQDLKSLKTPVVRPEAPDLVADLPVSTNI